MDDQYFSKDDAPDEQQYEVFNLDMDDDTLLTMADRAKSDSTKHWNGYPWKLSETDEKNVKYWLGDQMADNIKAPDGQTIPNMGNRMQTSSRAVLSYVNSRVAKPDVSPSSGSEMATLFAKDAREAMYQHGVDHDLEEKCSKATQALVIQKRGYLKLRFDPLDGPYGDIVVDYIPPEDVTIQKGTPWGHDGTREWHRQKSTIEELCLRFPTKKAAILQAYDISDEAAKSYDNMSKEVRWYEFWFTFYKDNKRKEGLAWYIPKKLVLGKILNPNFIYTGDDQQDRIVNFYPYPIKPFVPFTYMNTGKEAIDETSLYEQIKVLQDLYNKRRLQIMRDMDNQKGRTVVDSRAVEEKDATKFFEKDGGSKAILLIKPEDGVSASNSVVHIPHNPLPNQAFDEAIDYRNEIDQVMGTPNIFRGEQSKNNTLGQDERIIQQAAQLQDDLAKSVDRAMQRYYRKLFHLMKVYYTEDHWFTIKGDDGKYDYVYLNGETMDTNSKISVEAGSTLPINRQEIRDIAVDAANSNRIDDLSFWEAVQYGKLPDPETIVGRLQTQLNDPAKYMADVERKLFSREAQTDIDLLINDQAPPDRDEYNEQYINFFNNFISGKRFIELDPEAQDRIKVHIAAAGAVSARTVNLLDTQTPSPMEQAAQADMMMQEQGQPPVMPEQAGVPPQVAAQFV